MNRYCICAVLTVAVIVLSCFIISCGGSNGRNDEDQREDTREPWGQGEHCTIEIPCVDTTGQSFCQEWGPDVGCAGACLVAGTPEGRVDGVCVNECENEGECPPGTFCQPDCEGNGEPRFCIPDYCYEHFLC